MFTTTMTKTYTERNFQHFILFGDNPFTETQVFSEYWDLIHKNVYKNKEELTQIINDYIPKSKSKIRITSIDNEIEFFAPNKYIFPKFYIKFR